MRAEPGDGDIAIGGVTLAAEAAALGLIDDAGSWSTRCWLAVAFPFFPQRERRVDLDLVETRTFSSRVVYLATAWRATQDGGAARSEARSLASCCLPATARSPTSCSERRDLTTEVCYRRGRTARSDEDVRILVCARSVVVPAFKCVCCLSLVGPRPAGGSVARAISRSRRSFHKVATASRSPSGWSREGLMPLRPAIPRVRR